MILIKSSAIIAFNLHIQLHFPPGTEIKFHLRAFQNDHGLPAIKVHARD